MVEVDSRAPGVRRPGFDLALPLIGCVTLGKSLYLSKLVSSSVKGRDRKSIYLTALLKTNEITAWHQNLCRVLSVLSSFKDLRLLDSLKNP